MDSEHVFGDFRLVVPAGTLYEGDQPVSLPPRALTVLTLLVERAGAVVSKDELLASAWPDSFVSEDSLTHAISLIRSALHDDAQSPRYVQTVPRRGYRFVAEVGRSATTAPVPGRPVRRVRLLGPVAAAAAVIALAAIIRWWPAEDAGSQPEFHFRISRIGVVPVLVEPPEDAGLTGFAAELGATFAALLERDTRISAVPLVSADASGTSVPVQAVLTVELRRDAAGTAMAARLGDSATNDVWWRQDWLLPAGELDAARLARSMLTRLWPLLDVASAFSPRPGSSSKEANLLLVQSAELLFDAVQRDHRVALRAENVLDRAIGLDEGFARGRGGRVAVQLENVGWRPLTADEEAALRQDAAGALQDAPEDPVVLVATALLRLYDNDPAGAREALDAARRHGPGLAWIYLVLPDVELRLGQPQMALAAVRSGLELDPYLLAMHGRLVDVLLAIDDLEAAAVAIERLGRLDPGGYWSGRARARLLRRRGDLAAAEQELLQLRERWPDAPWLYFEIADLYSAMGRDAEADEARQVLGAMARETE